MRRRRSDSDEFGAVSKTHNLRASSSGIDLIGMVRTTHVRDNISMSDRAAVLHIDHRVRSGFGDAVPDGAIAHSCKARLVRRSLNLLSVPRLRLSGTRFTVFPASPLRCAVLPACPP